jgi:hypothetical protein
MDILNFISWIKGGRVVTSVNASQTLIPVGLKDGRRDDDYLAGGITAQDFITQVAGVIPQGAQGPMGPQGVAGPVGPAGLNWQGAWSALGTYVIDDAVGYGGASWFCIANVGPSATTPDLDPTKWALLASQGSPGAQGPQGIQGPQGPAGSGGGGSLPLGSAVGNTLYWNGAQWVANSSLSNNNGRVGIGTTNVVGQALKIAQTNPAGASAGIRIDQGVIGYGTGITMTNPNPNPVSFQMGTNAPNVNPIFDSSVFFNVVQSRLMKFSTAGIERLLIQANGQVTVGATQALYSDASFIIKNSNMELEEPDGGIILTSGGGFRFRLTVNDLGALIILPA